MAVTAPAPDDNDRPPFDQIHREYHGQINNLILDLVGGDAEAAEDLTVETFVNAFRHWDRFRGEVSVGQWLHAIAVNNCRNYIRSRKSAPPISFSERVKRAVESLPEEYRAVLKMGLQEYLSYEEIAERTGLSVPAVKTRLHRARNKVKRAMDKVGDWQIWTDADVATDFANRRRAEFLDAATQFSVMLRLLRRAGLSAGAVLDMGCGSGVLLEAVLTAYPNAAGVALDGSAPMLVEARERLAPFANVAFVEADFNSPDWVEKLPRQEYAAIVSGFAIHHSEDDRKRELYGEIFRLLRPGGVFINIEHVASATPLGEELFMEAWIENTVRIRQARGQAADYASVQAEFANRPDKDANRLAPVETQLGWLRALGFADVDCYWKHFELAILAGYRPR